MFEFKIEIAKLPIKIICKHDFLFKQCKDYLTKNDEYFTVSASKSDIDFEAELSMRTNGYVAEECYLESTAVYRKICTEIIKYDAFLMHSAVVKLGESAISFIGKSGAGKTTQSKFWLEEFGASYINGDKPIYRLIDGEFFVFGTPWNGKEKFGNNTFAKLSAIVKVNKAQENFIEKISGYDAVPLCLLQIYSNADETTVSKTMDLLDIILERIPVFMLYCKKEALSAQIAFDSIKPYL